jgi:hypothetical protein
MKKLLTLILPFLIAFSSSAQTADDIINQYITAAGGKEKLNAIQQIEVMGTIKLGIMGQSIELPVTEVREKNKLFRRQLGGIMGMGDTYTLITDTGGYVYIPSVRGFGDMPGTAASLTKLNADELAAQQYELDCAGAFAHLVDYQAKGHKAELAGAEKVNKQACTKLKLTLKSGQTILYSFDNNTHLVKRVEATGEMAANLTGFGAMMKMFGSGAKRDMKAELIFTTYQQINGIQYPANYTISLGPVETQVENTTIKINEGIDSKWYRTRN